MSDSERFLAIVEGLGIDDDEDQSTAGYPPELINALTALSTAIAPKARRIEGLDELGATVREAMSGIGNVVAAQASIAGELQAALERGQAQATDALAQVTSTFAARHAEVAERQTSLAEQMARQATEHTAQLARFQQNQERLEKVIDTLAELVARPRVREAVRDEYGRLTHVVDRLG